MAWPHFASRRDGQPRLLWVMLAASLLVHLGFLTLVPSPGFGTRTAPGPLTVSIYETEAAAVTPIPPSLLSSAPDPTRLSLDPPDAAGAASRPIPEPDPATLIAEELASSRAAPDRGVVQSVEPERDRDSGRTSAPRALQTVGGGARATQFVATVPAAPPDPPHERSSAKPARRESDAADAPAVPSQPEAVAAPDASLGTLELAAANLPGAAESAAGISAKSSSEPLDLDWTTFDGLFPQELEGERQAFLDQRHRGRRRFGGVVHVTDGPIGPLPCVCTSQP